jgi:hypothetical protein
MDIQQIGYFLYMQQCEKKQQENQQRENENGSQKIGLERERTTTNQK